MHDPTQSKSGMKTNSKQPNKDRSGGRQKVGTMESGGAIRKPRSGNIEPTSSQGSHGGFRKES